MAGVNKVILIGNLGKDPEVRHLEGGATVCNFPLATTESYKDKNGQRQDQTEWHNIVLWRGLADVAEKYLKKGSQIYLEGKLRTRTWDDKEGNKHYKTEVVGESFTMLGRPKSHDENNQQQNQQQQNTQQPIGDAGADDLPF